MPSAYLLHLCAVESVVKEKKIAWYGLDNHTTRAVFLRMYWKNPGLNVCMSDKAEEFQTAMHFFLRSNVAQRIYAEHRSPSLPNSTFPTGERFLKHLLAALHCFLFSLVYFFMPSWKKTTRFIVTRGKSESIKIWCKVSFFHIAVHSKQVQSMKVT